VLLGVGALAVGCAGAAAERVPAAAPVVAEPSADKAEAVTVVAPAAAAPAPAPPPVGVTTDTVVPAARSEGRGGTGGDLSFARSDLANALRQLQSSAGDCTTACRALGSMERATAHLCALSSSSDCQDAKSKVLSGRDRVRASCGECPGGPSLDKSAPIPSSR
jgi:hypothetical protein